MENMDKNQFLFLDNWLWGAKLIRGMSEWLIEDIKSSTGLTLRPRRLIGGPVASIWFLFLIFGGLLSFCSFHFARIPRFVVWSTERSRNL